MNKYINFKFTKLTLTVLIIFIIFCVSIFSILIINFLDKETISKCIVTINNSKYDVTDFIKEHPGGDVFECGKDISREFNRQHNESILNRTPLVKKVN